MTKGAYLALATNGELRSVTDRKLFLYSGKNASHADEMHHLEPGEVFIIVETCKNRFEEEMWLTLSRRGLLWAFAHPGLALM